MVANSKFSRLFVRAIFVLGLVFGILNTAYSTEAANLNYSNISAFELTKPVFVNQGKVVLHSTLSASENCLLNPSVSCYTACGSNCCGTGCHQPFNAITELFYPPESNELELQLIGSLRSHTGLVEQQPPIT